MLIRENLGIAVSSIRSQALRATLTVLIIAIGLMALVGILTTIDAIKSNINSSFSAMGANSFTIRNAGFNIHIGSTNKKARRHPRITYRQARMFSENFKFPAEVAIATNATMIATVRYESVKSNPNILVIGADENYLNVSGYKLADGRNFSNYDMEVGTHSVILGRELVNKLFKGKRATGELIYIGGARYKVIGTLEEKGSSMGFGGDKICILPISHVEQYYATDNSTYTITTKLDDTQFMEPAIGEAKGIMRSIRKDKARDEDSFEVIQSDSLANILIEQLETVTIAATIIGFITLLGAAIGLMNIMMVSVTERTREIGIRKAMGATKAKIRQQFLTEAVLICQMGGLVGIFIGIMLGNLMSMAMGGTFIIPWVWILMGFSLCFMVGLLSGIYPATKAAQMDPIECLRYE